MRALQLGGAAAVTVTGVMLLAACTPAAAPQPAPSATPTVTAEPTPLAAYDTTGVAVTRAPFCDRVSPTGIESALGGIAQQHDQWDDGDAAPVGDRGQEYGCSWSRRGTTARAWVFAPPVTAQQARGYVGEEIGGKCRRLQDQPTFGSPGLAMSCGLNAGGTLVRFAGLFGDAWLTCEVQAREADPQLVDRVGTWCVTALVAART